MDDLDDLSDAQLIHSALQGDLELVTRYGEEHPATWAGVWFDNEPTVYLVAAFTSDVAQHDASLRPRLRHPGRLVVQRMPHSLADLRQVRQEIERTLQQRAAVTGRPILTSIGNGKAVIHVYLRADQENVASELAARYGSAVELRVGAFGFPERRRRGPRPSDGLAPAEQDFAGLEVSVEVDQTVLEVGDDGHGQLVLRNNGQERIGPLNTDQPLVGSLLNASHEPVGGYTGWIAGTGLAIDLEPGGSASINVIFGTASFREELGYALPPGEYWLKVHVPLRRGRGEPAPALAVPLPRITIVPAQPRSEGRPRRG
ncbi:MAG TPA: hypothetical protein VFE59_09245 [Trebonia sp.]|nr:hypothetical protein [Trebonia sp.]